MYKINISWMVKNILWHMSCKRRNNRYNSCIICSIYLYTVHENMYNYAQLTFTIWWKSSGQHQRHDICKQKLIEYWFFDLQNFPCSMPLETKNNIQSNHRGISDRRKKSLQQKHRFQKASVSGFPPFPNYPKKHQWI